MLRENLEVGRGYKLSIGGEIVQRVGRKKGDQEFRLTHIGKDGSLTFVHGVDPFPSRAGTVNGKPGLIREVAPELFFPPERVDHMLKHGLISPYYEEVER